MRKRVFASGVEAGCDFHPHCLTCPLEICRYDVIGGLRSVFNISRDEEIIRLNSLGLSYREISFKVGISARTVSKVIHRAYQTTGIRRIPVAMPGHPIQ